MEIKIGTLILTAEHSGPDHTTILIRKEEIDWEKVDSGELRIAINALEKACWRP